MATPRPASLAALTAVLIGLCAWASPALATAPHARHARYGACDNTTLRPTVRNLEVIRTATICLVNRERIAHGETPLRDNSKLGAAAQGHTESMAWSNYFEHLGPGGQTPLDRMRAAGYIYSSNLGYEVGENIAWGTGS